MPSIPFTPRLHRFGRGTIVPSGPRAILAYTLAGLLSAVFVGTIIGSITSFLASNEELAQKFAELERKLEIHDQAITGILKAIHELMNPPAPRRRGIGFTADY